MRALVMAAVLLTACSAAAQDRSSGGSDAASERFEAADVFALEHAADPRVSPDGELVAYVRVSGNVMTDRFERSLWVVGADGSGHMALAQVEGAAGSPRWSPSGDRLLFTASEEGASRLCVLDMGTRTVTVVAELARGASSPAWSPDGAWIAFLMFTEGEGAAPVEMPAKPEGAEWGAPAVVIDDPTYKADGSGFLEAGGAEVYVVPADGGTPRRVTRTGGDLSGNLAWTPDGESVVFSANLDDPFGDPIDTDLYRADVATGELTRLVDRDGPDDFEAISGDGRRVAFTGFDDEVKGHQVSVLSVLDLESGDVRALTGDLDRTVSMARWDGNSLVAMFNDRGVTKLARVGLNGSREVIAEGLGGMTLGRPYGSAAFSVDDGVIATVTTTPARPADVAALDRGGDLRRLTELNEDVLGHKELAGAESITARSGFDGREIQAWVMRPPGFEEGERYPMILEIHGGPYADYGPRFSAECQLFAAAGYVVVYANPRGSTSYGEAFTDLINQNYPGEDYDDLMSVVDEVIAMGIADPDRLYVTGGSGGGVLTAWIVGKTDRFRAAVVAKPVINMISEALYSDGAMYFVRHWFPGPPWEHLEHYWEKSPLSLVGNVTTPTMLLTGEEDLRTPMAESEQYYQALHLAGVPTRMVRVPGASHGIAARPTGLITKVAAILEWFGREWE